MVYSIRALDHIIYDTRRYFQHIIPRNEYLTIQSRWRYVSDKTNVEMPLSNTQLF